MINGIEMSQWIDVLWTLFEICDKLGHSRIERKVTEKVQVNRIETKETIGKIVKNEMEK